MIPKHKDPNKNKDIQTFIILESLIMEISSTISSEELNRKLIDFTVEYGSPANKVPWDNQEQKNALAILIALLKNPERQNSHTQAKILQAIKIFTRNKLLLESMVDLEFLDILLEKSGLIFTNNKNTRENLKNEENTEVILEAQRCLYNIYLQCKIAQDYLLKNHTLSGILQQTTKYEEFQVPLEIIFFDMRIFMFLVSATNPEERENILFEHQALSRLIDILNMILEKAKKSGRLNFSEEAFMITSDVIKTLFCLTNSMENHRCNEVERLVLVLTSHIIQKLIILPISTEERKFELVGRCVNLLATFKGEWTKPLIEPLDNNFVKVEKIEYLGSNMNAPKIILDYLDQLLRKTEENKIQGSLRENLSPISKVLLTLSMTHKPIRKYYKSQILPPLRDFSKRPEEGNTLRNKLCRLLTNADADIANEFAEFLFILCNKNRDRFVKHVGGGNAAGFLAKQGLLMSGHEKENNSSDTDSDTEEYLSNVHRINPVTGHVELPQVSPFEGMTEEQKEYEANRLANLMHKLSDLGVVKPGKIGPNGTPISVDHVLELVENQNEINQDPKSGDESDD